MKLPGLFCTTCLLTLVCALVALPVVAQEYEEDAVAMFQAIAMGDLERVEDLIEDGVDPDIAIPGGMTPLIQAITLSHLDIARSLAGAGADLNGPGSRGMTPVLYATFQENTEAVRLLLELGADPNVPNADRMTSLFGALSRRNADLVELLIAHGADPQAETPSGHSVVKLAELMGEPELHRLMAEAPMDEFEAALALFHDRHYDEARASLETLYAAEPERQPEIRGYITASYYGAGRHQEGLAYLCERYRELPPDDDRYLFDVAAHIRRFALDASRAEARALIDSLRERCGRADFTPIWIAIPLAKMEHFHAGDTVLDESYVLDASDVAFLREVMAANPDDPYLPMAHYFLGEFQVVATQYPRSLAADRALYVLGRQSETTGAPESQAYYERLIAGHPESPKAEEAKRRLLLAHIAVGDFDRIERSIARYGLAEFMSSWQVAWSLRESLPVWIQRNGFRPTVDFLTRNGIALDFEMFAPGGRVLRNISLEELLDVFGDESAWYLIEWFDSIDSAQPALAAGDLSKAIAEYERQSATLREHGMDPGLLSQRIGLLERMRRAAEAGDPGALLALGIALRDYAEEADGFDNPVAAVIAFRSIQHGFPGSVEAQKGLYLAAAVLRRQYRYREAQQTLQTFLETFQDSHLMDDVLAELGLHALSIEDDLAAAREYFGRVLEAYPERNAADNALNWLAYSYLRERDYLTAAKYYTRLTAAYGSSRIGQLGAQTLNKLLVVMASEYQRPEISGVGLWQRTEYRFMEQEEVWVPVDWIEVFQVSEDSASARAGVRVGDVLVSVAGIPLRELAELNHVLEQDYQNAESVSLRVSRDQQELQLTLPLVKVTDYREPYYLY